ncbi:hypothetical protein BDW74DRAFT_13625 [Aspergillus multicolor]|uniref:uncharacterized protein n=1 Tax=Aspergillus multicolor TaxID=41759 RepID=UPI003CCD67C4
MLAPKPPTKLEGHCSVIHDNTLYTLSSNGFASIPLERNGTWSKLSTDGAELVSDAVCVMGGVDGNENKTALYVVGGTSSKSDLPGIQRYSLEDKTWKAITVQNALLSNRTGHSAVYLKSVSTILTYGGSTTDGSQPSSENFNVLVKPTYRLDSGTGYATPAVSPPLLTWSDDTAVLFGGKDEAEQPHFWNSDQHWHNDGYDSLNMTFPTGVKAALFQDSDGSRILRTFDLNQSPVEVSNTSKSLVPSSAQSSKKRKRDDSSNYDDSLAPTVSQTSYSFAQGGLDSPLVVISGGSGTDTLSIFNQTSNDWVNTTKLFYGDKSEQEILGSTTTTTTSSPTTTSSTESSATSTSDSSSDDSGANVGTILGAVLGSLMGVAVILVLILFYIKRKKEKARKAGGVDKDRLSFQDQGVEPLARSAYPMAESPAPKAAASVDSLAIFSGNLGDEKSSRAAGSLPQSMQKTQPVKPSPLNNIQSSGDSIYSLDDKAMEAGQSPVRRTTDEGWGKYFQGNTTPTLSTPTLIGVQSPYDSTRGSKATIWPGGNNALPPLQTSFLQEPAPLGRVNTGSPTTEVGHRIVIPESQSARISSASSASFNSDDGDYHGAREQSWLGRPPSSTYSRSFYNPGSTREALSVAPSMLAPSVDFRGQDSHRTNTRGSSVLIPDGHPLTRNNVNSDMSWLNLNADR